MSILLNNKILETAEQTVEAKLTPENRANYMRIVVAGMKTAMHGGAAGILGGLKQSKDPITDCAVGAINLVLLLRRQSRGTMPVKAMVPAAMTLMLQALDLADKAGIVKVGNDELVKATHIFTNHLFAAFKITAPMLQNAATNVHAITQDPTKMEAIKRRIGMSKAPNASEPTPLPAGANNGV